MLHDIINNTLRAQGDREGRRRPDRGRGRRRRPCRRQEPVRAGPGNPRVVRRPAGAVGRDRHRRRGARRAGDGRRLRLHRLGLHRHRRGARRRRLQAGIVDGSSDDIVYSNLFTGVHGNYLKALDPRRRPGPGQPARRATRRKMNFGSGDGASQGLEGHLGLRPGHRRGARGGAGARAGGAPEGANTKPRASASGLLRERPAGVC